MWFFVLFIIYAIITTIALIYKHKLLGLIESKHNKEYLAYGVFGAITTFAFQLFVIICLEIGIEDFFLNIMSEILPLLFNVYVSVIIVIRLGMEER